MKVGWNKRGAVDTGAYQNKTYGLCSLTEINPTRFIRCLMNLILMHRSGMVSQHGLFI